ncbi:MAG TPA: carboxypeptidase-like regulatory domain-containing protein [Candidatus Limnocylindrales bacterium]
MSTTPSRRLAGMFLAITVGLAPFPIPIPTPASAAGATAVAVAAAEFGTISGVFIGPAGPMPSVRILAKSMTNPFESVRTSTVRDGTFSMRIVRGDYKLSFQPPPGLLDQWAPGAEQEWAAKVITVAAGAEIKLEERALPTARIEGRLTDAAGRPVASAGVVAENPGLDRQFQATTDEDGEWFLTVRPGTYAIRYATSTQAREADPVTVEAGKTVALKEALAVPGSLTVRSVDTVTGLPVTSFCADAHTPLLFAFACTEDGVAEFDELGPASYTVGVSDGEHLNGSTADVVVTSGGTAQATVALRQGATIVATVTDAATGEPVGGGVCLSGQPADHATEFGGFVGGCTDFDGTITMPRVIPDSYVFFAAAFDGVHGSQWVGPQGGVGAQVEAAVVTAVDGGTTTLAVRLDGQGEIAGVITDQATGEPIESAEITTGGTGTSTSSGPDGSYALQGLGPYRWVLYLGHADHGGQWSGGGSNRFTATRIPVRVNESTRFDEVMREGAVLTGRITGPAGQPPDWAEVSVVNAKSFDILSHLTVGSDGSYTARLTGPQEVKLHIIASVGGLTTIMWYPNGGEFAQGRTVPVPPAGTTVVDIPISS